MTTTSSKEVTKANKAPEITPGVINGTVIRKKVVVGEAPKVAAERVRLRSNPTRVAVTVITTNGVAKAACARITPTKVPWRLMRE